MFLKGRTRQPAAAARQCDCYAHLGALTREAQAYVAQVAEQVLKALSGEPVTSATCLADAGNGRCPSTSADAAGQIYAAVRRLHYGLKCSIPAR